MVEGLEERRRRAEAWTMNGERERVLGEIAQFQKKRDRLAEDTAVSQEKEMERREEGLRQLKKGFESCLEEVRDVIGWYALQPKCGSEASGQRIQQLREILGEPLKKFSAIQKDLRCNTKVELSDDFLHFPASKENDASSNSDDDDETRELIKMGRKIQSKLLKHIQERPLWLKEEKKRFRKERKAACLFTVCIPTDVKKGQDGKLGSEKSFSVSRRPNIPSSTQTRRTRRAQDHHQNEASRNPCGSDKCEEDAAKRKSDACEDDRDGGNTVKPRRSVSTEGGKGTAATPLHAADNAQASADRLELAPFTSSDPGDSKADRSVKRDRLLSNIHIGGKRRSSCSFGEEFVLPSVSTMNAAITKEAGWLPSVDTMNTPRHSSSSHRSKSSHETTDGLRRGVDKDLPLREPSVSIKEISSPSSLQMSSLCKTRSATFTPGRFPSSTDKVSECNNNNTAPVASTSGARSHIPIVELSASTGALTSDPTTAADHTQSPNRLAGLCAGNSEPSPSISSDPVVQLADDLMADYLEANAVIAKTAEYNAELLQQLHTLRKEVSRVMRDNIRIENDKLFFLDRLGNAKGNNEREALPPHLRLAKTSKLNEEKDNGKSQGQLSVSHPQCPPAPTLAMSLTMTSVPPVARSMEMDNDMCNALNALLDQHQLYQKKLNGTRSRISEMQQNILERDGLLNTIFSYWDKNAAVLKLKLNANCDQNSDAMQANMPPSEGSFHEYYQRDLAREGQSNIEYHDHHHPPVTKRPLDLQMISMSENSQSSAVIPAPSDARLRASNTHHGTATLLSTGIPTSIKEERKETSLIKGSFLKPGEDKSDAKRVVLTNPTTTSEAPVTDVLNTMDRLKIDDNMTLLQGSAIIQVPQLHQSNIMGQNSEKIGYFDRSGTSHMEGSEFIQLLVLKQMSYPSDTFTLHRGDAIADFICNLFKGV
ncbi:unnamed protein product [Phytomonas sp. Hart1]|nr:unnamed protein product [Phytomonas sp. Hart1]|eukprot:CCW69098.1 unnamed protein product [Phytomonas sp. isolate Hart1]